MLKKIAIIIAAVFLLLSLVSCSAGKNKGQTEQKAETLTPFELEEKDKERVKFPFGEGCYLGEDYALELVFTGNGAENAYNAVLYRKDTGVKVFTGNLFEIPSDASVMEIPANDGSGTVLTVEKNVTDESLLKLVLKYKNTEIPYIGGEYKYYGDSYTPDNRQNADFLTPGIYDSENGVFLLEIVRTGSFLKFMITDKTEDEPVFVGNLTVGLNEEMNTPIKSAVLLNIMPGKVKSAPQNGDESTGSEKVEFEKRLANGKVTIEVVGQGAGNKCDYSGVYVCRSSDYMEDGIYKCGGKTVKLSSVTVRAADPGEKNKIIGRIMLIDEKGDVVFTGTKELDEKQYPGSASFSGNGGKLLFFKGFDNEKEYIEVMNLGYIGDEGFNERYELSSDVK